MKPTLAAEALDQNKSEDETSRDILGMGSTDHRQSQVSQGKMA